MNSALPVIRSDLLQRIDRLLLFDQLAIGDFTYWQSGLEALTRRYPNIRIDIWAETRHRWNFRKWRARRENVMHAWAASLPFVDRVYGQTYSPRKARRSLQEARSHDYPLVISFGVPLLDFHGRSGIRFPFCSNPPPRERSDGWVSVKNEFLPMIDRAKRELPPVDHVSDLYALYFETLFGICIPEDERRPRVSVPDEWLENAHRTLTDLQITPGEDQVIYLNPYAAQEKRSWPIANALALVSRLQREGPWTDAAVLINTMPRNLEAVKQAIRTAGLQKTTAYSATSNFFELPAIVSFCDLVITVDTGIMHLAMAADVPLVALMRPKRPEWRPYRCRHRLLLTEGHQPVSAIDVEQVWQAAGSLVA